jgi:hypothetical protein
MGEDATAIVDRMTDRLRSDSDPRGCAQFLQAVEPRFPPGKKNVRIAAFRGAQKDEFLKIVVCPRRPENRTRDYGVPAEAIVSPSGLADE